MQCPKDEAWIRARYGRIVAVDLDATLLKYDEWIDEETFGDPLPGAIKAMMRLRAGGYIIVIHTCRRRLDLVESFLKHIQLPFDYIEHKPYADYYVDDRAIRFQGSWEQTLQDVKEVKPWFRG